MKPRPKSKQASAASSNPATDDRVDYTGTKLTLTYGMQKTQAVQFNTFDVGPFGMEITVQANETLQQAQARGMTLLKVLFEHEWQKALQQHLDSIFGAATAADNHKRSR